METDKPHVIPQIAICDGCTRADMLGRINAENQFFCEALEEETGLAETQQNLMQQAAEAGNKDRAALHEWFRDQHVGNVASHASNVQGEVDKINRLNKIDCEAAFGGQPECARYIGYASQKGGVNLDILKREAGES